MDKVYYRVLRHRNDTTLMANGNTVLHYLATFYIFFKASNEIKAYTSNLGLLTH